jgi:hypothetical protein
MKAADAVIQHPQTPFASDVPLKQHVLLFLCTAKKRCDIVLLLLLLLSRVPEQQHALFRLIARYCCFVM